ncbi:C40 family peptidase [Bacillus sp. MRMR6]|uniref:coiled-coil domain-containing protein n=1 Tax=Bacillus sp. MRMR6 TaxID=1928617 RepID=UPI000A4B9607|nr:C40 family peptidase [Bacillus sp. MRMR6]
MKKKITLLLTTIMLGIGSTVALPNVKAEENNQQLDSKINRANEEILQVKGELDKLTIQINKVNQAITDNDNLFKQTEENIKSSQLEIHELDKEISSIKDKIAKRHEVLKKRALSMQQTGGKISYLDVLFGSSSLSDFIDRATAVVSIVEADQSLVEQHETDIQEVEKKQVSVEEKLSELEEMKIELEGIKLLILEQKMQNDQLKTELEKKKQEKTSEKLELQQQKEAGLAAFTQTGNNIGTPIITAQSTNSQSLVSTSVPKLTGSINDVILAGYKYIGNSVYVFGGGRSSYDIANGRFDCSGFVHWAFSQAGINVGASTDSLKNSGTRVTVSQMQPGDLVFFNTYKTDGHVGIYIGGGKFIGSQSSTGVAVADMTSGYWKQTFNGRVNRIISK